MESSPLIHVQGDYEENQVIANVTLGEEIFFRFSPFESDCTNFPIITYKISSKDGSYVAADSFPFAVQHQ
jgi:hypothetical protein